MDDSLLQNLIKVGVAVLAGGIIGAEREYQDKAAGFRTIILITVGSTLFTIYSMTIDPQNSMSRVAANIVTGIGFLGAGAIVREGGRIAGLTTAAAIWLSAALGMGIGAGDLYFSLAATFVALMVLLAFPYLESLIDRAREARVYRVVVSAKDYKKINEIEAELKACGLRTREHHQAKTETSIINVWHTIGSPRSHAAFLEKALRDKRVKEIDY